MLLLYRNLLSMRSYYFLTLLGLLFSLTSMKLSAQDKGTIAGVVKDASTGETLVGVNVFIRGTSIGTATDIDGNFSLQISPGEYAVEFTYIGYEKKVFTGIRAEAGQRKVLNVSLGSSALTFDEIVIVGEKPLVDVDDPKGTKEISTEIIEAAPAAQIQQILNTQAGIVQNPEGIHIRGGRTYETGFYIDGVSASDPLAGTGFGLDIGTNSISNIEITTSGADVAFGDATAGVVNTQTRSGGEAFSMNINYKRDNFGNEDWNSVFNQQIFELGMGGPVPTIGLLPGKLRFFTSLKFNFSDDFTKNPADQLNSSLYPGTDFWSPYQDNRWSGMLKLNYDITPKAKLMFSYLKSLTVNQDFNMLRITSNDVPFTPGYQFNFALQPDNANTYTHDTNLETLRWMQTVSNQFSYNITFSRLFVKLRADANGRNWRPEEVDTEFDPRSIVSFPAEYFNPDDEVVFVNPGPGLYNNNGIATLWHDHYVLEYTLKAIGNVYSKNAMNRLTFGTEFKHQEMQWIDITRPWIGAPIQLPNGEYTQSFRLGDMSDVWSVKPVKGAFFVSDKIKYLGLITEVGARLEYWFPGKFVDDAVNNPDAPIRDEIRQAYLDDTYGLGDRRFKMRLLPKVSASFPIKENQMMYFNYSHSTISPHPSYIYTGLDPYYADRSTLARLGNPNLDPEVDISYELGLRSQITSNDALNIAAFWKDKYDFITAASVLVEDVTGREVSRTIRINSDYARVRGLEVVYIKRIGKWFNGQISASYSVATGQSSSSSESIREIQLSGNRESTRELPLAWDSPLDLKAYTLFNLNRKEGGLFGKEYLNKASAYIEAIYRTGKRYTPYILTGYEPVSGRPIYEQDADPDNRFSEIGESNFWINLNLRKWWNVGRTELGLTLEITNLLNNKNTAIVNPVTGRAYEYGDPVPTEWRDPQFIDPRDPRSFNTPPDNPARFYEQRHYLVGVSWRF